MPYSWKIAQLLFKEETTEGTLATLGNDDAGIEVLADPDVEMDIPHQSRTVMSGAAGTFPGISAGLKIGRLRFRSALTGSGTAGTAPTWARILKNGGFVESGLVSNAVYAYSAAAWSTTKTATAAININGLENKVHGSRAKSLRLVVPVGEGPILEVEQWGGYNTPAAVALSTPTYSSGKWEGFAGATNTFSYDSTALEIGTLEINIENECEPLPKPGLASNVLSVHGAPGAITGSVDFTVAAPTTYDYFVKMIANTTAALSAVVATTTGSILTIAGPAVQITGLKHERRGHTLIYRAGLAFHRNAGNDSLTLTLA